MIFTAPKKRNILTALLSVSCLTSISTVANAATCPAASGGTITATGQYTDPCIAGPTDNFHVASGGSIFLDSSYANGAAVDYNGVNADNITNDGEINSGNSSNNNNTRGISILGSTLTTGVINNGTITSMTNSIDVQNSQLGEITNNTGALIDSTNGAAGIAVGSNSVVGNIYNDGTINGQLAGGINIVSSEITNGINNDVDGQIHGGISKGINLYDATIGGTNGIENSGTIDGSEGGINIDGGSKVSSILNVNTGTISSDGANAVNIIGGSTIIGGIQNDGVISTDNGHAIAVDGSTVGGDIVNNGSLTVTPGNSGNGINISGASSLANILNSSTGIITTDGVGIYVDKSTATSITNDGQLNSNSEGITVVDGSVISGAVTNSSTGAIQSNAGIDANGAEIDGGISNSGTIDSSYASILVQNGAVIKSGITNTATGSLSAGAGYGIIIDEGTVSGGILNSNTIEGGEGGIQITDTSVINGDLTNNGTISTNNDNYANAAINIDSSTIHGKIVNNGTITGGQGVSSANGITVTSSTIDSGIVNANGKSITGDVNGIYLSGTTIGANGISNSGTITGTSGIGLQIADSNITGHIVNSGTITGDTYSIDITNPTTAIIIDNSGTLNGDVNIDGSTLNLNSGSIMAGAVSGTNGTLNINTDFTTNADYSLGTINIASGKTFTANHANNFTVTGAFNNHGTFDIGSATNTVTVTGNYAQDAAGKLEMDASTTSNYSKLHITGTGNFAAGTNIDVNVTGGSTIVLGNTLNSVITTGGLTASTFNVTDNSSLFDFEAILDGNNIDLRTVSATGTSVQQQTEQQGNSAGSGAAHALDNLIATTPSGDAGTVVTALATLPNAQAVSNAVSQTLPAISGGTTTATLDTMDTIDRVVQARIESNTGLSSGEDFVTSRNFWLKPFGSWSDQDNKNGVAGFDANTYGIIAGADGVASGKTRVGAAFAYANSDLTSNSDAADQSVRINSYQGIFYGSYSIDPKTDLNFQTDFGYNSNEGERRITFGGLSRTADSDYGSWSAHLGTGIGHIFDLGQDTTIVPSARIDYSMIRNDSYNETGAGALNLKVDSQFTDQLIPAFEAKLNHKFNSKINASINGGVGYDVLNSQNAVTSNFVGGGGEFVTRGIDPSPWVYRSGAGLSYQATDTVDVTARYDREDRGSSFDNQTVSLKVRIPF